jgi:hypothetical protein
VLALALVVAAASLPSHGVLVPFDSLAGVRLGETRAQVRTTIGTRYTVCTSCDEPSWFYFTGAGFQGGETGLGISFRGDRVAAIYTLGQPRGWRTAQGLRIGEDQARLRKLYGRLKLNECVGFMAHSAQKRGTVTTFFTTESFVSGFALTAPGEPVCR